MDVMRVCTKCDSQLQEACYLLILLYPESDPEICNVFLRAPANDEKMLQKH